MKRYKILVILFFSLTLGLALSTSTSVKDEILDSSSKGYLSSMVRYLKALIPDLQDTLVKIPNKSLLSQVNPSTAQFGTGKVWQVGPTRQYKKPSEVVTLVQDGDTVEIDSAIYKCDTSVKWRANNLTLRGVGGLPHLDAKGCSISGGKAIWNPVGKNLFIENIEFSGAKVSDTNGAGIRYDGGGEVIIRNSYFHDNENGILFTPSAVKYNRDDVSLLIEYSKFSQNGYSDGKSHNFYIQKIGSFTFRYNISESSKFGHLVKTRAKKNYILYNRLTQLDSTGSYEIDISEGGETYIIGNIIQQGANSENRGMVAYAGEGRNAVALDGTLDREMKFYFINNTLINDHPVSSTGINLFDFGITEAIIANNLVTGLTESHFVNYRNPEKNTASKTTFLNNVITASPGFNDRNQYSYYLTASSPAVDAGTALGIKNSVDLRASQQYMHEARVEPRPINASIDAGAYEYDGRVIARPTVSLSLNSPQIPYNTSATISWDSKNTSSCTFFGSWSGIKATSGQEIVGPFTADAKFFLNCTGVGGSAETEITLLVRPNPDLVNYPDYEFIRLPNTKLRSICNESGDLRGTNGCNALNSNLTATYDSKRNTVYFWQGGSRNYWGNGVSVLDLNTKTLSRATESTEPKSVIGYIGKNYNMVEPCDGRWALTDRSGVVPAPIHSYSAFLYLPDIDKVASLGGKVACSVSTFADNGWFFDPSAKKWDLKYQTSPVDNQGANALFDNKTNTVILGNTKGIHRYDYRSGTFTSVGGTAPRPWNFGSVVDPRNKLWLFLGGGLINTSLPVLDIANLSTSNPLPNYESNWQVLGDIKIIQTFSPGVAYDPVNKVIVGWAGDGKIYFIEPDTVKKMITIFGYQIKNSPIANANIANKFMYIPSMQAFLVFAGIDSDIYLLKATGRKINLTELPVNTDNTANNTTETPLDTETPPPATPAPTPPIPTPSQSGSNPAPAGGGSSGGAGFSPSSTDFSGTSPVVTTANSPQTCLSGAQTPSIIRNLAFGSKSDDVLIFQKFLVQNGYITADNATGFFGKITESAIKSFQTNNNIVSSGNPASTGYGAVGPATRARINHLMLEQSGCKSAGGNESSPIQTTTPPSTPWVSVSEPQIEFALLIRNIALGARGDDVKILQNLLINRGYLTDDNATGYFGYLTQSAVQSLQKELKIVSFGAPDTTGYGAVGPITKKIINNLINSSESSI